MVCGSEARHTAMLNPPASADGAVVSVCAEVSPAVVVSPAAVSVAAVVSAAFVDSEVPPWMPPWNQQQPW